MADQKLTAIRTASPFVAPLASTDLLYLVQDVATTPDERAITGSELQDQVGGRGWIKDSYTWTRTGNHTFTVAADVSAILTPGTKVRYKDGGAYEYGVVYTATYSSPNTTVTLITNTSYTMAAATITDNYFSYADTPPGFPTRFLYALTWAASGTQPAIGAGTISAWWVARGRTLFVNCQITMAADTTYGTGSYTFSLPVTVTATGLGSAMCFDAGTAFHIAAVYPYGTTALRMISEAAGGDWGQTNPHTWATTDYMIFASWAVF